MAIRFISAAIIMVGSLWVSGCDSTSDQRDTLVTEPAKPRVLLVMKSLVNPFYIAMEQGARQAAEERGVELVVKSGTNETLVEQQAELIEEQLNIGFDALVIAPADSIAIIPVLRRVHEAGIKIVNVDNQIDRAAAEQAGLPVIPFVSVDNYEGGFLAGQYLASLASPGAKVLILEGPRSAANARQRRDGARDAFLKQPGLEIVDSVVADWKLEQAYAQTSHVFKEYPDLDVVFAANDMMALGTVLYAQENGLDQLLIGGYDNIPDANKAVSEGRLKVTVDQQADQQGYHGVMAATDLLQGKPVQPNVLVDVMLITQ